MKNNPPYQRGFKKQSPPHIRTIKLTRENGSPTDVSPGTFQTYLKDPIALYQMLYKTQQHDQSVIENLNDELDLAEDELKRTRTDQQSLEVFQTDQGAAQWLKNVGDNEPPIHYSEVNNQRVSGEAPKCQKQSLEGRLSSKIAGVDSKLDDLLAAQSASQDNAVGIQQQLYKAMQHLGLSMREFTDTILERVSWAVNDELEKLFHLSEFPSEQAGFLSKTNDPGLQFQLSLAEEIAYKQAMSEAANVSQLSSEEVSEEAEMATEQTEPEPDHPVEEKHDPYEDLVRALMAQAKENEARERALNESV
ncbi:uncharacterized protein APUU_40352S [Aspergillus puulaauensis]|uniref:Uncharacterized protein n=1 Tax=Aspergillus puulaauensis TaxID=1220207 RepID=A0A7R7XMX6_9EURO|nr:uncharacterized protein APUU_40352S [Aspergillus puulaauensis]BCS23908.1 hypothetical protein APUU_40352S [Aspergillus puulaauensis]